MSAPPTHPDNPVVAVRDATVVLGERTIWSHLNLQVSPGEFIAILGPNGSGKSTLLKAMLGQVPLAHGDIEIAGKPVHRGNPRLGYIPQQQLFAPQTPARVKDLVAMGINGTKWGLPLPKASVKNRVNTLLTQVGAAHLATESVGALSGGEQQRVRVAQALATDPDVLLCDEPLLSLDLTHQRSVSALINQQRVTRSTAVLFVTHEINPILPYVGRVLYLVDSRFRIGTPQEVLTSAVLSELYGSPVQVLHLDGQIFIHGEPTARCDHEHTEVA
ncbi:metal ABC transporter ATP-binding protein [Haematomicrobium sanguinis]|uniref:metal ABC transporter ATP-binding protein n=1 Tax=Haematomicrobium sanguinis TaxID=479106 RepID=UPI00047C7F81|nr:ABC transporter ATP-binding protein [Haematomicrobium sanguinis]